MEIYSKQLAVLSYLASELKAIAKYGRLPSLQPPSLARICRTSHEVSTSDQYSYFSNSGLSL